MFTFLGSAASQLFWNPGYGMDYEDHFHSAGLNTVQLFTLYLIGLDDWK